MTFLNEDLHIENILSFEDVDILLNRCIMLGQFEAAVNLCLSEQRYTEALLLAHLGGQELLFHTQKRYFEKVQTSSTKVLRKIFDRYKLNDSF